MALTREDIRTARMLWNNLDDLRVARLVAAGVDTCDVSIAGVVVTVPAAPVLADIDAQIVKFEARLTELGFEPSGEPAREAKAS